MGPGPKLIFIRVDVGVVDDEAVVRVAPPFEGVHVELLLWGVEGGGLGCHVCSCTLGHSRSGLPRSGSPFHLSARPRRLDLGSPSCLGCHGAQRGHEGRATREH